MIICSSLSDRNRWQCDFPWLLAWRNKWRIRSAVMLQKS
jgi:hypothetical protein